MIRFLLLLVVVPAIVYAESIAVVPADYDDVTLPLKAYGFQYREITLDELVKPGALEGVDVLFLPSGVEPSMEKSVRVYSSGRRIRGVNLVRAMPDREKLGELLKNYIETGGTVYFSGYSVSLLRAAYPDDLTFHYDFPSIGLPGRILARPGGNLSFFAGREEIPLYMDFAGWVAPESVEAEDAIIYAEAEYDTPKGKKEGPVAFQVFHGEGRYWFSSYYRSVYSDFRRFLIHRVVMEKTLEELQSACLDVCKEIEFTITDTFRTSETRREYHLPSSELERALLYQSTHHPLRIEIRDASGSLLLLREDYSLEESLRLPPGEDITLRLYHGPAKEHMRVFICGGPVRVRHTFVWWIAGGVLFLLALLGLAYLGKR